MQFVRFLCLLGGATCVSFASLPADAQTVTMGQPVDAYGRAGDDFVQIMRMKVSVPAATTLTQVDLTSLNTNDQDAGAVSLYYTGSSALFSTNTAFGDVNEIFATPVARSPGSDAGSWTNGLGAYADGGTAASVVNKNLSHVFGTFGFNGQIPAGSEITGITLEADAWHGAGIDPRWIDAQLSWNAGTTFTTARKIGNLTAVEARYQIGPDLWGRKWTPAEFDNANFQVKVTSMVTGNDKTWNLDFLRMTVRYRSTAGGGTATFRGSQALAAGDHYFHAVYAIAEGAAVGNALDAKIPANGLTIGGATYPAAELTADRVRHVLPRAGFLTYDTLESGVGAYTSTMISNVCTGADHPWATSALNTRSPVTSWFFPNRGCQTGAANVCNTFGEAGKSNGAWTLDSPAVVVPADTTDLALTFWQRVNLETAFDGGWVQYSINGGAWNELASSKIRRNPYNNSTSATVPSGARAAWNGDLYGSRFAKVTADLTGLGIEGTTLKVRWRAEQDDCTAFEGWFVDDIGVKGFPTCREPLAGTDLNDTAIGDRVCPLPYGVKKSGQQSATVDETDWWLWDVSLAGSQKLTLTITSLAQFDLFVYQKDGTTLVGQDAPGLLGTVGVGATRTVSGTSITMPPGTYLVKVQYVSGTSSYDLLAEGPTPLSADVSGFRAEPVDDFVRLSWDVEANSAAASFRVVRTSPGEEQIVGPDPMAVAELPASFSQDDLAVVCGESYEYRLEEISLQGAVDVHGPVTAVVPCASGTGSGTNCACSIRRSGAPWVTTVGFSGILFLAAGAFALRRRHGAT